MLQRILLPVCKDAVQHAWAAAARVLPSAIVDRVPRAFGATRNFHASISARKAQELETLAAFESMMRGTAEKPAILDFYADWCGPCKQMLPRLEAAVDRTNGRVNLYKINIDKPEFAPLLTQIRVQSVPTLIALFGAKMLDAKIGAIPQAELDAFVARVADAAGPSTPDSEASESAASEGDTPEQLVDKAYVMLEDPDAQVPAIASLLVKALEAASGPLKAKALAGLARCSLRETPPNVASARELAENATATAADIPEVEFLGAMIEIVESSASDTRTLDELEAAVSSSAGDPAALHALAVKQFLSCQYAAAFETGLRLVKQHRSWENERGKETVLKFLKAVGPRHPVAAKARNRLSNLLFV